MSGPDRAVLDRAFSYPYAIPPYSYLFDAGYAAPIDGADFAGRVPVLAYGSNAAPDQLIRKFGTDADVKIPVTRASARGIDVVYAALFARYGSVPATIHEAPGAEVYVHVTWLDEGQLGCMHESEGAGSVYLYGSLPADRVTLSDSPTVDEVYVYVAAAGVVGPSPIALASVPAKRRSFSDGDQPAIQALVRDRLAPGTPLEDFVAENVADDATRGLRSASLAGDAVARSVPGFTPLS